MAKILIIEDDKLLLDQMKEFLEDEGYQAILASNAFDGINLIETTKPDLIILDINVPRMDGFELLSKAKKMMPASKIIVYTASNDESMERRAKEIGADHYLVKSMKLELFGKLLKNSLSR